MARQKKGPKVVLSGYFGFDNCGDEAILYSMIHCLKTLEPEVQIVVLSGNPQRTRELYGVKAVDRWKPLQVLGQLLGARLFISGGGSLLQDVTSPRSPKYYLGVLRLAQLLGKRNMVYAQGIGPLNLEANQKKTVKVFEKCTKVILRDENSAKLLKDLGLKKEIQVTCDPVLALTTEDVGLEPGRQILEELGILDSKGRKTKPLLVACPRCWKENRHLPQLAAILDNQAKTGCDVLLAPAHYPEDMEAIAALSNMMDERVYCVGRRLTATELMSLVANGDKVLSMRLHGLIFAMAFGVPMTAVSYDPKVISFMEQACMEDCCVPAESFSWFQLADIFDRQEIRPVRQRLGQAERQRELRELAWQTAEEAVALLKR